MKRLWPGLLLTLVLQLPAGADGDTAVTFHTRPAGAKVYIRLAGEKPDYLGLSESPVQVPSTKESMYHFRFEHPDGDHEAEVAIASADLEGGTFPTVILPPKGPLAWIKDLVRHPDWKSVVALLLAGAGGVALYREKQKRDWLKLEPKLGKKVFGPYYLLQECGRGGFGVVYRAVPTDRPNPANIVALKQLIAKDHSEYFAREIKLSKDLVHPNIIEVKDYGDVDGEFYFAMEFVYGDDLRKKLPRKGFGPEEALRYLKAVCSGLAYAHSKGIMHRDLKPDNVRVGKDGSIKLMDFGLARKEQQTANLTGMNLVGSLGYMAPEQLTGMPMTLAVDIYAFGILAFELLCGQTPVPSTDIQTAEQLMSYIEATQMGTQRTLDTVRPDLAAASQVIAKMLEVEPQKRYATITEAYDALEKALRV